MAQNLDELKDDLYKMFNQARGVAAKFGDFNPYNSWDGTRAMSSAIRAAAETARSIAEVEHEIAERDGVKPLPKLPGKPA
jgi:hypothetical protein